MLTGHQTWKHIPTAEVSAWTLINIYKGMGQCFYSRNHKTLFNSTKHFDMDVTKYVRSWIIWWIWTKVAKNKESSWSECNMVHKSGYLISYIYLPWKQLYLRYSVIQHCIKKVEQGLSITSTPLWQLINILCRFHLERKSIIRHYNNTSRNNTCIQHNKILSDWNFEPYNKLWILQAKNEIIRIRLKLIRIVLY